MVFHNPLSSDERLIRWVAEITSDASRNLGGRCIAMDVTESDF
jgi:hypothetical protein